MRWMMPILGALFLLSGMAHADAPPVIDLCNGSNTISISIQNNGLFDVTRVKASVDPALLPEWLRFNRCMGAVDARKGERAGDRLFFILFVDNPPFDAHAELPITLTDDQGYVWTIRTMVRADSATPAETTLSANYPNPFNPSTTIRFSLKEDSLTKIDIYNSVGQKIRTLVSSPMRAGAHSLLWNGRDERGLRVASGVYFCQFSASGIHQTRKMVLAE